MAGKVKVGVVGCGVVAAAYYLPYLMKMENAELIAVCDRFETRTNACARLFGAKQQYRDYDNMIDRADIEAVLILTAPGTHVPFTLKAVEAGKHVLIQKLMATNMADARKIAAAIRKNKVKALIEPSSSTPLEPEVVQLRQLIRQGCWEISCGFRWLPPGRPPTGPGWATMHMVRMPSLPRTAAVSSSISPTRQPRSWGCWALARA